MRKRQGHAFHGDIDHRADAVDRGEGDLRPGGARLQLVEQAALDHACAARDQVHWNADPGMHVADHPLHGHRVGHAVGAGGEQLLQPALQRRLQVLSHLVVGEVARGARVVQQHGVEVPGQSGGHVGGERAEQGERVITGVLQAGAPGRDQRLRGVVHGDRVQESVTCSPKRQYR